MDGTVFGMFYLCNVIQLVIDRLNQGPFFEQNLVGNAHQRVLHIVFNFSDKLNAIKEKILEQSLPIYHLSAHSFPLMFSRNLPCFNGSRSSTFPDVNIKLRISHLSLIIRCNLNPKNRHIEHFPRSASPSNVLWIRILWLRQTRKGVESTKLMPVHVPGRTFLMKMVMGSSISFSSSTKRL